MFYLKISLFPSLTDVINNVFGFPLLLNFMSSSLLVCFVGFQMSIGLSPEQVCKLAILLVAATLEIYLICYFSDLLMTAVRQASI